VTSSLLSVVMQIQELLRETSENSEGLAAERLSRMSPMKGFNKTTRFQTRGFVDQ